MTAICVEYTNSDIETDCELHEWPQKDLDELVAEYLAENDPAELVGMMLKDLLSLGITEHRREMVKLVVPEGYELVEVKEGLPYDWR